MMATKKCTKCGEEYPVTEEHFSPDKNTKSGFRSWCKICSRKAARENKATKKSAKIEGDLEKYYMPNINMKLNKKYSFIVDRQGKGTERKSFRGEVIQICEAHIVFKTKNYIESFQKVELAKYKYLEV